MPPSQKRLEANRRNAKKSTGPRTKVGKKHVRMNARTHALYADPTNLPGEDPQQTSELVKQVRESLQPQGPLEDAQVDYIISIMQELRRISRASHVHSAELIRRKAVARVFRPALSGFEEDIHYRNNVSGDKWTLKRSIAEIYANGNPKVQANDLDGALDITISDEREVAVTAHVDRRKRQLMEDLDDALARLHDLQAARQAQMVILPPERDGDQTSMGNQIEAPQRLALELYNNGSDKNVYASKNAQDHVTIWLQARVTIRRFATSLAFVGVSFLKNKAKYCRESNVLRRFTGAITRHFPRGHGQIRSPE